MIIPAMFKFFFFGLFIFIFIFIFGLLLIGLFGSGLLIGFFLFVLIPHVMYINKILKYAKKKKLFTFIKDLPVIVPIFFV